MKNELHQAYLKAKEEFIKLDGVIGVGFGPKIRGKKEVVPEAIIIFVEKKLPRREVPEGQTIPSVFEGFPTDVRVPKLTIKRGRTFDPNAPPKAEDECLTDYFWIDWGKIHQMNQQQNQKSAKDEPADLPTTQVVGELLIIKDPSKSLVTTVAGESTLDLAGAYNIFRRTFGDHYDFVTFFVDVGSGLPDIKNASSYIFNNVGGIGWPSVNDRSAWMSSTKLLRHIHHTWFTLRTLLHELCHQWCFYVDYRYTPSTPTQDLLHQDWPRPLDPGQRGYHWGRFPDNDYSCMDYDYADWIDNGDGTFNRMVHDQSAAGDEEWFGYVPFDQYLMGLIPASDVPIIKIIRNPSPTISASSGPYTPSPSEVNIGISNVRYEEGLRSPDYLNSQRVFHQAFIVITKNTTVPTSFITNSQTWRTRHTTNFRRATEGRAMVDTSLLQNNYSDLYIKDNDSDTGLGSSTGRFWLSPDLWVRNSDDSGPVHQDTIRGQSNWIYATVRNKGSQVYNNVTVNFYLANFSTLVPGTEFLYPVDWNPGGFLGSATISVPARSGSTEGTAIAKIQWTKDKIPPAAGWHACLLCEVIPMEVEPSRLHHVFENKKLAQRNITIIAAPKDLPPDSGYIFNYKFAVGHYLDPSEVIEVRIQAEQHNRNVHLFLDTGALVEGLSEEAEIIETNINLPSEQIWSDPTDIFPLPPVHFKTKPTEFTSQSSKLNGVVFFIPSGTDIGIAPVDAGSESRIPRLRFLENTRLQFGYGEESTITSRYHLEGLKPVLLQGKPLLQVVDPVNAKILLRSTEKQTHTLRLIVIVSTSERKGTVAAYDLVQMNGSKVVGGVRLQLNI